MSRLGRSRPALLTLIVLVGAGLRFWGVLHGLADGLIYHADAHLAVHGAWHLHLGGPFSLSRFGAAYGALSWLALEAADLVARTAGYPIEWTFPLIGSVLGLLTALLGTLTILAVYLLGLRAFGHRVGLLAAALVAVSPLHTFHSHYPYRDVPMVFVLTLTLAGCVTLAARPGLLLGAVVALGAGLTAALKPAGLVVAAPLAVALGLAWRRRRTIGMAVAVLGLVLVALAGVSVFLGGRSLSPVAGALYQWQFAYEFVTRHGPTVVHGAPYAFGLLVAWLGWPAVVVWGLGFGVALWRHRVADVVLVAFLVPAFVAAAAIPWLDERFLVYLVPPSAVLVARLLVGLFDRTAPRPRARVAVALAVLGLLTADLGRSAWQDVLLSLPDTRALAGRWFEAHIPRATRVGVEGYFPVGLDSWPHASYFEPRKPLRDALASADILVTSSLEHIRYHERPRRFSRTLGAFFRTLAAERAPMRTFSLATLGFAHSEVAVYATRPPRVPDAPSLLLPRPYDHTWNGGVAFLEPGPYDRDDRTVFLGGGQRHDATLVAHAAVEEVAVFVVNGPEPSRIRVQVGWRSRRHLLEPGAWHVFHFRPRWWWPVRPALYRLSAGLLPEGRRALVQIRAGPREIGQAYAAWGRWAAAVPYLERAAMGRRGDAEILLLLGTAYGQLGRPDDARRVAARLEAEAPGYRTMVAELARAPDREETWTRSFESLTGLDPALLTAALARDFRLEALLAQGRLAGDAAVPGGVRAVFERGVDAPGLVLNGPRGPRPLQYLAPGAYRARFTLRGGPAGSGGESAVLRVFAERRLLAVRPVTGGELGDGRRGVQVMVPFVHDGPPAPVAVQIEATGRGSFAVEHVRIEPDLAEGFRQRQRGLQALAG